MSISLDTPEAIGAWRYLSAVSQLGLELTTGMNYYGRVSVYKGIRGSIIPEEMLPARATRVNKVMALTMLCYDQPSGAVVDRARAILAQVEREEGIAFNVSAAD